MLYLAKLFFKIFREGGHQQDGTVRGLLPSLPFSNGSISSERTQKIDEILLTTWQLKKYPH
jgi:hypothetical protein